MFLASIFALVECEPARQTDYVKIRANNIPRGPLRRIYSLNYYMHQIYDQIQNYATPHDNQHLLNCSLNSTYLTVRDLWTNPKKVATFLKLYEEEVWQTPISDIAGGANQSINQPINEKVLK